MGVSFTTYLSSHNCWFISLTTDIYHDETAPTFIQKSPSHFFFVLTIKLMACLLNFSDEIFISLNVMKFSYMEN